jgi:hypothetical protein
MAETIYADQVTNISIHGLRGIRIHGGVVRLELAVVDELPKTQNESIKMRIAHHLVLPLDAFVKAFEIQQAVMNKLIQDGVLKKREEAPVTTQTEAIPAGMP